MGASIESFMGEVTGQLEHVWREQGLRRRVTIDELLSREV